MPTNTRTEFRCTNSRGRDKRKVYANPRWGKNDDDWRTNVRFRKTSPFRGRVGNGKTIKGCCSHCNPKLCYRVLKKFMFKEECHQFMKTNGDNDIVYATNPIFEGRTKKEKNWNKKIQKQSIVCLIKH